MPSFADLTPEQIRAHRETVLLRLVIRVNQAETNEVVRRLHARGHEAVQPSYIGLLANIDTEGTRVVVLAQRTGNTRQAVSQLAAEIERRGYLERVADPTDGRAVLVRHTKAGRQLLLDALEDMADIEAGYEQIIGPKRMRTLKEALTMIADATDPTSALRDAAEPGGR
jgi:DNA-binding MarR family transcriptional regulator